MREGNEVTMNRRFTKRVYVLLGFSVLFFILMMTFFNKGKAVDGSLVQSELYSSLGGLFLGLFALSFLATITFIARKRFWKILAIIGMVIFLFATLQEMRYVLLLTDDKSLYEKGEFETYIGTPDEVKYDHDSYVFEIIFSERTFKVHHLEISQTSYEENFKGNEIEIQYLPNSKLPISVEASNSK